MSSRPKAPVRTPRPNVARINSTKNSKASAAAWKPSTTASTNPAAKGPPTCPNTSCTDPCLEQHSGQTVCVSCGTVVSDANIVSEVQFGETSGGAAIVQGAFVGENEGHARSNIPGGNRLGLNSDSREKSDADGELSSARVQASSIHQLTTLGKRKIGEIGAALAVPQTTQNAAFNIWRLCTAANFIQGRRINQVAAVCLYIACRKLEKENKWMLIDFSDLIQVRLL
jgi:transcription factor IIIB subunit 2